MIEKNPIPSAIWVTLVSMILYSFIWTPNFLLTIPVVLYIPLIYFLFYRRGNASVLFWGLLFQWLNVSIQLLYCNLKGLSLMDYFSNTALPADLMNFTVFLSIFGLYVFTFGVFAAIRYLNFEIDYNLWLNYNPAKLFKVYILISLVIYVSQVVIWRFPSFVQYSYFLFYVKWGFFLVTFISIFNRALHLKLYLILVIIIEFVIGLSSFFASSFMNILLFSLIGFMASTKKISFSKGLIFLSMICLLFHLSILWTASKGNYRSFLNEGNVSQAVTVSDDEAREKLLELIVDVDDVAYQKAIDDFVNRIGYIQFFAACISYVPSKVPHENGAVYWAAISHYLVPRFINPDKPALNDSEHTNKYTNLNVSGTSSATSFSLGSFADAYIDFGSVVMFIPIFFFGYLIGLLFKLLNKVAINSFWGLVFTGPYFLLINVYGADTAKALGFVLIYSLIIAICGKFLIRFLNPFITVK